jgi:hypothetical protein
MNEYKKGEHVAIIYKIHDGDRIYSFYILGVIIQVKDQSCIILYLEPYRCEFITEHILYSNIKKL